MHYIAHLPEHTGGAEPLHFVFAVYRIQRHGLVPLSTRAYVFPGLGRYIRQLPWSDSNDGAINIVELVDLVGNVALHLLDDLWYVGSAVQQWTRVPGKGVEPDIVDKASGRDD